MSTQQNGVAERLVTWPAQVTCDINDETLYCSTGLKPLVVVKLPNHCTCEDSGVWVKRFLLVYAK